MKRLRGNDAYSIYSDTKTSPFVTLKVAIYRPVDPGNAPNINDVLKLVHEQLASTGGRKAGLRILRVPFDLHHPLWIYDPDFSPSNHIHQASLPAPGGKKELCEFLSDLMSKPLRADRPPWEIRVLDGLENGRFAIVFKVHHSLADGNTMAEMIRKSHCSNTDEHTEELEYQGEPVPGSLRLIGGAMIDLARSLAIELPRYYLYYKKVRKISAGQEEPYEPPVAPFSAPRTVFDGLGGPDREYWYETFSLAKFKALAKQFNCTVNTLILFICSEAFRRYLKGIGNLPDRSLICAMPVAGHLEADKKLILKDDIYNNDQVSIGMVLLHQDIDDYRERIDAISVSANAAIRRAKLSYGRRIDNYFDFIPAFVIRAINRYILKKQASGRSLPFANAVISNVKGPREKLYALRGKLEMEQLLSTGNLADGGHLNITVWSYVDQICFSFYMRKGRLPDWRKLTGHFRSVVEEIEQRYLVDR